MRESYIIRDEKMREQVAGLLSVLNLGKPWRVTIEHYKRSRSLEQNNLYHKWLGIIASETGNSHNDVHEWCKHEFLPPVLTSMSIQDGIRFHAVRRSTAKLKIDEMSHYMNQVQAWAAADLGITLPVPEDRHK